MHEDDEERPTVGRPFSICLRAQNESAETVELVADLVLDVSRSHDLRSTGRFPNAPRSDKTFTNNNFGDEEEVIVSASSLSCRPCFPQIIPMVRKAFIGLLKPGESGVAFIPVIAVSRGTFDLQPIRIFDRRSGRRFDLLGVPVLTVG